MPKLVLAAYHCKRCDVKGRGKEIRRGAVKCWKCGKFATITARVSGGDVR